jgi:hypothetical protein
MNYTRLDTVVRDTVSTAHAMHTRSCFSEPKQSLFRALGRLKELAKQSMLIDFGWESVITWANTIIRHGKTLIWPGGKSVGIVKVPVVWIYCR